MTAWGLISEDSKVVLNAVLNRFAFAEVRFVMSLPQEVERVRW